MGLLQGRVAVITGAGGGLGRAHALAMAREGARIVVNDLGSTRDGTGKSERFADKVVEEILALGGEAVANADSVATEAGAEAIIQAALERFGKVDILVNNAGILRDKTLLKLDLPDWDLVIDVHLKGTFLCSRAAARWMKESQVQGTIINTTSYAGLMGNFGQTNYAAAKAGIYGLTRVHALELSKYGITVNAIAPMAKTRMTEDIEAVSAEMRPEQVSPMVVFLASDLARDINGRIFGVHGGHLFEYRMQMTSGVEKAGDALWTPFEIQARFPEIERFKDAAPAAKGDLGPADLVDIAFQALPDMFDAVKAKDWAATILFDIDGAGPYTIHVKDGACRLERGRAAEPTCTVNVVADVWAAILQGKLSPEKAFMEGKVRASNLADMLKFATAFDMKKGRKLLETKLQAGASAAPKARDATPAEIIETAFGRLPEIFVPERTKGWDARIAFDIEGAAPYLVRVKDATLTVERAKAKDPTCIVSVKADVYAEILRGRLSPEKAFMEGKIKATNLGDMMRFASAFDMKKGRELADKAMAAPGGKEVSAVKSSGPGLNRAKVGSVYRGAPVFARPEDMVAYAHATNDTNPWYVDESRSGGVVAPPLFCVRLSKGALANLLTDPDLNANLLRLVHGEQELIFHRSILPWDLVAVRAGIQVIEEKSTGEILKAHVRWLVDGSPVVEGIFNFFFRGEKSGKKDEKAEEKPEERKVLFTDETNVTADQPIRYGHASLDTNPIHMDDAVARQAGLPGKILQGLCTMAFTSRAVTQKLLDGDPRGLERLFVRFSKPVFPGDRIQTRGFDAGTENGKRKVAFEAKNQDGVLVIQNGLAVLRN